MPPRGDKKSGNQFIFVGGPVLTDKRGPIRSQLFQQAHRQRKSEQRRNAEAERESLMQGGGSAACTCQDAPPSASEADIGSNAPNTGLIAIRPKVSGPQGLGQKLCAVCGKSVSPRVQVPALKAWDLGAGGSNPVMPINEATSGLRVQEILHFASTIIWPNFRPGTYSSNCYRFWAFPPDDKIKLYALLWSASYHKDILSLESGVQGYRGGSKEQLKLKGLALECLRKEVNAYTGATPIDSIIMCILFFAVNDTHGTRLYRDASPFNPPFKGLHSLDFYGSRDYHPAHWAIIQDLLGKYGGVEALKEFAIAWLLSISDIMGSAHTLSKPIYPCLGVDGKKLSLDPPLRLFEQYGFQLANSPSGSGFNELLTLCPPVRPELVDAFSHIGQLCCVLQYYSRTHCSTEVLDRLGDSRNYVHYHLFSSPDESDADDQILADTDGIPEATKLSREWYLTCRLALLLFATHVTYPIPRSTVVREPLLQKLCPKLQLLVDQGARGPLLLWCVCVALVTSDMDPAGRMPALFKKLYGDLKLTNFNDLLILLRRFAWVDSAAEHQYGRLSGLLAA